MLIDDYQPQEIEWCDICRSHASGECDGCHTPFEATDQRYRSQSHHFHPGSVAGIAGMIAIHKVLCVDCYRLDHERVYKSTAPPLPDRGMDPKFWERQRVASERKEHADLIEASKSRPLTADEAMRLSSLIPRAIK